MICPYRVSIYFWIENVLSGFLGICETLNFTIAFFTACGAGAAAAFLALFIAFMAFIAAGIVKNGKE